VKDFTWEYIVENCERYIQQLDVFIAQEPNRAFEAQRGYLKSANGLKVVVPKLRAHPELGKSPPMMSLLGLRWLLGNDLEVELFYSPDKEKYEVAVVKWSESTILKATDVGLDEVVDTVCEFIGKVRNQKI